MTDIYKIQEEDINFSLREKIVQLIRISCISVFLTRILILIFSVYDDVYYDIFDTAILSIGIYIIAFMISYFKDYKDKYYVNFYLLHLEVFIFSYYFMQIYGFGYGFEMQVLVLMVFSYFTMFKNKIIPYIILSIEVVFFIYLYLISYIDYSVYDYAKPICFLANVTIIIFIFYKIQIVFKVGKYIRMMTSENQQKYFKSKSSNDRLTEVLNIYSFKELIVVKFLSNDSVTMNNISFISINIQDFKFINDKHGYAIGDEILRTFAKMLKNNCENDQLISRMGGDKFIIAIFNEDEEYVLKLANTIKDSTKMNQFTRFKTPIKLNIGVVFANFPVFEQINQIIQESLKNMEQCKVKQEFIHFSIYEDEKSQTGGGNYKF